MLAVTESCDLWTMNLFLPHILHPSWEIQPGRCVSPTCPLPSLALLRSQEKRGLYPISIIKLFCLERGLR